MSPRVSVITAVFNGAVSLNETIGSILTQNFTDFEYLIVNDGSTDRTPELLEQWSRKDKRLIVIHQPRAGQTASLIRAMKEARGEYLARQDADDISLPQRLQRQVEYLDQNSSVGFMGCATEAIDEQNRNLGPVPMRHGAEQVKRGLLTLKTTMVHTSIMMRRLAYDAVGGYRLAFRLSQDIDLWLRMVERFGVDNLEESLVQWRLKQDSVYTSHRHEQLLYGGVALAFSRERHRFGADSYAFFKESNGDLKRFASNYRLRGLLNAIWGELLFRAEGNNSARAYLAEAIKHGPLRLKTGALFLWSLTGLSWPGGKPLVSNQLVSSSAISSTARQQSAVSKSREENAVS